MEGGARPLSPAIIRRNLHNASMMGICPFTRHDGLERGQGKPSKLRGLGAGGIEPGSGWRAASYFNTNDIKLDMSLTMVPQGMKRLGMPGAHSSALALIGLHHDLVVDLNRDALQRAVEARSARHRARARH